ncbi:hypothetical protein LG954_10480, partial [Bifidobacterium longum subsp. infantis]|uniref:hypothetical protein n=1 Tax=Bifidobacterium longum TaxID=216816 RepID=UPI001CFF7A5C
MKGAEAARLRGADPELLSRVYFYVDTGNGITPESDVGTRAHDVELTNLYDAFADPLGLKTQDMNAFELAVIRAGFDGYLIRQFGNQGAAVLVGRRHKAVPVRRTGD